MQKLAKIVEEDGKFKLYNSKKTKVLGTHDSYEDALRQERAIWASKRANQQHDLIFYSNRSTPQVVPRGSEGKKKKGYGKVTKRRSATADEEKVISSGKWLRVDEKGNKPSSDNYKKTKYRPQLVKDATISICKKILTK